MPAWNDLSNDQRNDIRSRLIAGVKRSIAGANLQRDRIIDAAANAPRPHAHIGVDYADLSDVPVNDLDHYIFELGRLRLVSQEIIRIFGKPPAVQKALDCLDAAVPELWDMRNALMHADERDRLDRVESFSQLVRFTDQGEAETLVDPKGDHHAAAQDLAQQLLAFLRQWDESGTTPSS